MNDPANLIEVIARVRQRAYFASDFESGRDMDRVCDAAEECGRLREAIGREKEGRWADVTRLERERDSLRQHLSELREAHAQQIKRANGPHRPSEDA